MPQPTSAAPDKCMDVEQLPVSSNTRPERRLKIKIICRKRHLKLRRFLITLRSLSYDVAIIQWITSCHKNSMTTRVITLWRVNVTTLTTSTVRFFC